MSGWIGVDLDGTLAEYHGWNGGKIGAPIPAMVDRVKEWRRIGREVRIFTARVAVPKGPIIGSDETVDQILAGIVSDIQAWCLEHIGEVLPITNVKDFGMIELWDDRAIQVIPNTGMPVK